MTRYLFYDDEIANSKQYICSLGYVCTDDEGNELARDYELIDPESDFGYIETGIHGLTAEDTEGKRTFKEYCEETGFLQLLSNCVFVAHGARSADLSHLRKSLERYGMELPSIKVVDTKAMADCIDGPASSGLEDVCDYYGVQLEEHHNALEDALACSAIYWCMLDELEHDYEAEEYTPGETRRRAPKRKRPAGTLGLVNGSTQTIEELLDEIDTIGLLGDIESIADLGPCAMAFSGTANGMGKKDIEDLLKGKGYEPKSGPNGKTKFLAVGDNVGQSKIDAAKKRKVTIIALADLLDALMD